MTGIVAALLTAYDVDGSVDVGRTAQLVDRVVAGGVHGIFAGGTTGEALLQTTSERKALLEAIVDRSTVPVIAHVGAVSTTESCELAKHAAGLDVAGISTVTPFYYWFEPASVVAHVDAVAQAAGRPVHVYHIPARTGVRLPVETFVDLAERGVLAGVKYSSTDLYLLAELLRLLPDDVEVLSGSDEVLLAGLALGAAGAVGSTYSVVPETFVALYDAWNDGDVGTARKLQWRANALISHLVRYDFLAFLREISRHRGLDLGPSRPPLPPLTAAERSAISAALDDPEVRATVFPADAG